MYIYIGIILPVPIFFESVLVWNCMESENHCTKQPLFSFRYIDLPGTGRRVREVVTAVSEPAHSYHRWRRSFKWWLPSPWTGVSKNRGKTPKMEGENNGKTLSFNGWFGGKTHHFRKHPFDATPAENHARAVFLPKKSENLKGGTLDRLKRVVHISMNSIAVSMPSCGFLFDGVARKHNVTIPFAGKFQKWSISHQNKKTRF